MACRIQTYEEIDRAEWSRLVAESETGTWFQTEEAFLFFLAQKDLFDPFVFAVAEQTINDECLEIRGVCVGYVTVEKNPIKQFFTRRAIIIGGPAIADDATEEEVSELLEAIRNGAQKRNDATSLLNDELMSPIYIETRNFNDYSRWKGAFEKAGFEYQPHLNFHVDCTDAEAMWERMSENRKRQVRKQPTLNNVLRTAIGSPIEQSSSPVKGRDVSEADIREWYAILAELYRTKVKTPLWPVEFFLEAYRQKIGQFMLVRHDGKIIGGTLCVVKKPTSDSSLKGREEGLGTGPTFASVWGAHTADSTQYDLLKENARANRKNPTEAESVMWDMLKTNNLGLHFRRQHIILDYIVDFICLEKGLVIEIDGGYHTNPEQKDYDDRRTAHLQQLGYTELRFTNEELLVNPEEVAAKIKAVATKLPSLQGGAGGRLGTVYEWFECGRNAEYKEQYPSVMATWAGMQYAAESGCARYDMMGAGVPGIPYGVRDFKSEFGGEMVEHGRFLYVAKPWLYKIGAFAVKMLKRS